jgi:hypothetical protein
MLGFYEQTGGHAVRRRGQTLAILLALLLHVLVGWLLIRAARHEPRFEERAPMTAWVITLRPPAASRDRPRPRTVTSPPPEGSEAATPKPVYQAPAGADAPGGSATDGAGAMRPPPVRLRRLDCLGRGRNDDIADQEACGRALRAGAETYEVMVRGRADFDQVVAERKRPRADPLKRYQCELGELGSNLGVSCPAH